jgi:asparagine synthase (glutamine-hydrolysing)
MATDLPPGKQLHLAGITGPIYDDYVFASGNYADHVEPLHSQPVSEVMLQIPTYVALVNGVSRGLARRAFADLLPDEIRRRQVKGTGNPFYQHVVRHNLELLREHLLDGRLVADGYLDRRKLAAFLSSNEPVFVSVQASRLLSYLSAEIWLHQWADLRQRIAA